MIRNLIIIGGGPAGNAAALTARSAGVDRVTLVERDALGGTCTNRGCIPTKLLLSRSEQLGEPGVPTPARGEWSRLQTYKRGLVRGLAKSIETRCREAGVEVLAGEARLVGATEVEVRESGGTVTALRGKRILIAAGSEPESISGVPADGRRVITSDHALELSEVPESVIIVGSGAVGSEFATIFSRFGATVTIVEAAARLFPGEDPEVGEAFLGFWEAAGVRVVVGDPMARVETNGEGATAVLRSGVTLTAATVLLAAGRRPVAGCLGCAGAGIDLGPRGEILVDGDLRTSANGVYAAGDVTGRMLLAHVAEAEGKAAARHALGLNVDPVPYPSISWASFTKPEVASVGIGEEAARRAGIRCATGVSRFVDNVKSRIDRATSGFAKVVADARNGRVIGGTVVGAHASDMIHSIAMAIHSGMTARDLERFVFLHPSVSETIGAAVSDLHSVINTDA